MPVSCNKATRIHLNILITYTHVEQTLTDLKINHKILIADLGQLEKQEQKNVALRRALYNGNKAIDVENYHTYEEVMAYLSDLASTNPLVSTKVGGTSEEGRDIVQLIISSDLNANKPVHFFDCNIHAREWISAATCIWIIDKLSSGYGSDPEITALVDQYDWKFVPISNPDGYAYTWSTDRNWRKTRIVNKNSTCIGVDVNRNFLVGFGGSGSSSDPCSEIYHGVAAFSERESSALRDLIASDNGNVKTAFSIHSYGQLWASPYGYTSQLPADYFEMIRVMGIGVGALSNTYDISSGDTIDYYYDIEGVTHSYIIEVRDKGAYGHVLIRAFPETKEQLNVLQDWSSQSVDFVDFWYLPTKIGKYSTAVQTLINMNINHKIQIADLGELERQEKQSIALRRALFNNDKAVDFENYHTYEEVMAYLSDLASTNPLVSTKVGGTSEEGRDIVQAIISSDLNANKPVLFFECNMHAREWITAATCIWIIDQITSGYGSDAEITALVDQYDWKFIPIANPDGYAYTWSNDRLWRKNRVFNNGSTCLGVDVNRNFPVGFGGSSGSSDLACSTTYSGESAFSELESRTIRDLVSADRGRVKSAISVHSYDQQWLSPYGYSIELPPEYSEMLRAMEIGVSALTATYGTQYTYDVGSGVTTDYYYEAEGVLHSYTIELRDDGTYGFLLPPDQIIPTAIETWNGIKAFVKSI
uniref:Peptidase M14 domain-containing protein n=1 Tax=Daphnia galeata TaxID=27404 RepID=A0A8J2RNM4_9CRUS|nr:unnamed protein product [Daphnia galeata]